MSEQIHDNSQQAKNYRNTMIFIFDVILFFTLLAFLPFDPAPNKALALLAFVAVLWLTEALHVTITALFIPVLSILLGLVDSKRALVAFADPTIFLFFGGFALATALHIQKIDKLIANKIMVLAKGNLFVAVLYLFLVTAVLSMWMSNTATAAMMLPLSLGLLSNLDKEKDHDTFAFVILGIAYSAGLGGMGTLVGSPPNAIAASQLGIGFAEWLYYGLPMVVLLLPATLAVLYFNFRPKFNSSFEYVAENIQLDRKRITTLGIFLVIALCWVFGDQVNNFISPLLGLKEKIGSFDSLVAMIAVLALCATRVTTWKQLQEGTEWGVLFLFGGGLTLSYVLSHTGASKIMAEGIVELIEGKHYYIICLIIAAFICVLTEFTSNTASAALLVPIFISIAQSLQIDPRAFALIIGFGASCAFMMPVGTPPNAIAFSTGIVTQRDMLRSYKISLVCIITLSLIGYFVWLK